MFKNIRTLYSTHSDRLHLVIFLATLQVMDILTTQIVLDSGGTEGNPLMNWVIGKGWGYAWLVKFIVMLSAPAIAIRHRKTFIFLIYLYVVIIINNLLVIRGLTAYE